MKKFFKVLKWLGLTILLLFTAVFKAKEQKKTPTVSGKHASSFAYGKYLAHDLGNSRSCHSKIDNTGKQERADFAGYFLFVPYEWSQGYTFVSANITPHKTTGVLTNWTEENFISRFKTGCIFDRTPMPRQSYSSMSEPDLRALFSYM